MFIPTQEERYSKRTFMTLVLCVMLPCAVYAYFHSSEFTVPVDSLAGMLNLLFFFTHPLAVLFLWLGAPSMSAAGVTWGIGGTVASLFVHLAIIYLIYRSKMTVKGAVTLAVTIGFADLLAAKIM